MAEGGVAGAVRKECSMAGGGSKKWRLCATKWWLEVAEKPREKGSKGQKKRGDVGA